MEFKTDMYYRQGYNYAKLTPDGTQKVGGNCQTAALIIGIRMITGESSLSVNRAIEWIKECNHVVLDEGFSPRIVYPTISYVIASQIPTVKVELTIKPSRSELEKALPDNYYWKISNAHYLNPPKLRNLIISYGNYETTTYQKIIDTISKGGISIPLLHTNTLHGINDSSSDSLLHAVIVTKSINTGQVKIIDPEPGIYYKEMKNKKGEPTFKVKPNTMSFSEADSFAKKYHPRKTVVYEIDIETFRNALRGYSTNIIQE